MSTFNIDLLMRRLDTDYPTQYNNQVLRDAASYIRELIDERDYARNVVCSLEIKSGISSDKKHVYSNHGWMTNA